MRANLMFQSLDLQWQDNAEFTDQTANTVIERGAFFYKTLAGAVQAKNRLLMLVLDRHETHVRAGDRFADRGGIGRIILAALAGEAIWCDELGREAVLLEKPRPVVHAGTGFHAD